MLVVGKGVRLGGVGVWAGVGWVGVRVGEKREERGENSGF